MKSRFVSGLLIGCILISLLIGTFAVRGLPWGSAYGSAIGLDFQNLHAFHRCNGDTDPYRVAPGVCKDVAGRGMVYPPLLFWSYVWVRPFTLVQATWIWTVGMLALALFCAWKWLGGWGGLRPSFWFVMLLFLQVPMVFSIERGNNDWVVVGLWTWATLEFSARRYSRSGVALGLGVLYKLYPLIPALAAIGTAMACIILKTRERLRETSIALWSGAFVLTLLIGTTLLWGQMSHYLTVVLPGVSQARTYIPGFSHSLITVIGRGHALFSHLIFSVLLVVWARVAAGRLKHDPKLALAGLLACSTYSNGLSWDYNLVTWYPLLWCLAARAFDPLSEERKRLQWLGLLAILCVGQFGARLAPTLVIWTQIAALIVVGLAITYWLDRQVASPSEASSTSTGSDPVPA